MSSATGPTGLTKPRLGARRSALAAVEEEAIGERVRGVDLCRNESVWERIKGNLLEMCCFLKMCFCSEDLMNCLMCFVVRVTRRWMIALFLRMANLHTRDVACLHKAADADSVKRRLKIGDDDDDDDVSKEIYLLPGRHVCTYIVYVADHNFIRVSDVISAFCHIRARWAWQCVHAVRLLRQTLHSKCTRTAWTSVSCGPIQRQVIAMCRSCTDGKPLAVPMSSPSLPPLSPDASLFSLIDSFLQPSSTHPLPPLPSSPPSLSLSPAPAASARPARKARTYTCAVASQHCHICSRRPGAQGAHVVCGNLKTGRCRKSICVKCFDLYGWDVEKARQLGDQWECVHCKGTCPPRAQCVIYNRTSDRRRLRMIQHRKRKQTQPGAEKKKKRKKKTLDEKKTSEEGETQDRSIETEQTTMDTGDINELSDPDKWMWEWMNEAGHIAPVDTVGTTALLHTPATVAPSPATPRSPAREAEGHTGGDAATDHWLLL